MRFTRFELLVAKFAWPTCKELSIHTHGQITPRKLAGRTWLMNTVNYYWCLDIKYSYVTYLYSFLHIGVAGTRSTVAGWWHQTISNINLVCWCQSSVCWGTCGSVTDLCSWNLYWQFYLSRVVVCLSGWFVGIGFYIRNLHQRYFTCVMLLTIISKSDLAGNRKTTRCNWFPDPPITEKPGVFVAQQQFWTEILTVRTLTGFDLLFINCGSNHWTRPPHDLTSGPDCPMI